MKKLYPDCMTRSHLTLAALASSALPDLTITESVMLSPASSLYATALMTVRSDIGSQNSHKAQDGLNPQDQPDQDFSHIIVKLPRRQSAESTQSAELVALGALTEGVRARLPFHVPQILGSAAHGPTRAIIYDYIYGQELSPKDLNQNATLAVRVGEALAALHNLPTSVASQAGLIQYSTEELRKQTMTILERASATGQVPGAVEERWFRVAKNDQVWQFSPTIIHSAISADRFLVYEDDVIGIRTWQGLKVADPALDLSWIMTAVLPETAELILDAYQQSRDVTFDAHARQRTALYAELELARWLLHGTDLNDPAIIDDAVGLLHSLHDRVLSDFNNPLTPAEHRAMDEYEVTEFLTESVSAVADRYIDERDQRDQTEHLDTVSESQQSLNDHVHHDGEELSVNFLDDQDDEK